MPFLNSIGVVRVPIFKGFYIFLTPIIKADSFCVYSLVTLFSGNTVKVLLCLEIEFFLRKKKISNMKIQDLFKFAFTSLYSISKQFCFIQETDLHLN